ncbi:hypothetical protein GGI43DRAFT_431880 [Trichoderma evansii]
MPSLNNLKIYPLNLTRDWDPLFRTFWRSWSVPRQAAMVATFPHIGQGGPEEVESFEIIDESQPLYPIVGGVCLTHWKEDQDQKPKHMPDESHEGFEPGSQIQKVSEQLYGQLHEWHRQIMWPREHIFGQAMWILPEYRQLRAAPNLIMKTMEELCDKHDVEGYGEFVQISQRLGVKSGFELISKDSQELVDDFQSEPIFLMVRPKKSDLKSICRPTFVGLRESKLNV